MRNGCIVVSSIGFLMMLNPYDGSIEKPVKVQEVIDSGKTSASLRVPELPTVTFLHSQDLTQFLCKDA